MAIALPLAAVFLLGFFVYRQFAEWDRKIANATSEVNTMLATSEAADASIARTETIDQFLDSDVNWLDEIRRLAAKAPPSEDLIVTNINGTANTRSGGGTLRVSGSVTDPGIIDAMEVSLRDEKHSVIGKGSGEQKGDDSYRWPVTETLTITGPDLRNIRYSRMAERDMAAQEDTATDASQEAAEPVANESSEESSDENQPSTENKEETEESTEVAA